MQPLSGCILVSQLEGKATLSLSASCFLLTDAPYSILIGRQYVRPARSNRINQIFSQIFQSAKYSHLNLFTLIKNTPAPSIPFYCFTPFFNSVMYLLCPLFTFCSPLVNPIGEVFLFSLMSSKYLGLYVGLYLGCSINILTDNRNKKA